MSETSLHSYNSTNGTTDNVTEVNFPVLLSMTLPAQLICLLGLAGNGVVLWFLCFAIQRNPFTIYIVNLAAADFTVLLCTTVGILYILFITTVSSALSFTEAILFSMKIIFNSGVDTSLFLLTAISLERCISVFYPIWYKCHRPAHLSTISCAFIWAISILITILEGLLCRSTMHIGQDLNCTAVMVFMSSLCFGIIFPVMTVSNILLIFRVTTSSKIRQPMRLYRAILINVLVFLVTAFLPKFLRGLLFFEIIKFNDLNLFTICLVNIFLLTINSSANPYIYFLVGKKKKTKASDSIKVILHRVFHSDHQLCSPDDTLNSSTSRAV